MDNRGITRSVMHPYLAALLDLAMTLLMVACLAFHLFFIYVGTIQTFNLNRSPARVRAPWCFSTEGCLSLPLGPHNAVDVPWGKYQGDPGVVEEVAINLLVNLVVATAVSTLMAWMH
jgi:hypothetical protein